MATCLHAANHGKLELISFSRLLCLFLSLLSGATFEAGHTSVFAQLVRTVDDTATLETLTPNSVSQD